MTIVLEARNEPYVSVRYFFADDETGHPLRFERFSQSIGNFSDDFVIVSNCRNVPYPSVVFFGNDQYVSLI